MNEHDASEEQLRTILQAQPLLDDHATVIQNFFKENHTFWEKVLNIVPLISGTVVATIGILHGKHKNVMPWLVALPAMTIIVHHKYTRWCANRDLKQLVSSQSDMYYLCKRGLKILRHSYGIKIGTNKSGSKFTDLGAERLKFLQPILETMVKSIGGVTCTYYRTTQIILDLLPISCQYKREFQSMHFQNDKFVQCGEICYESVKQLYYTYILIQSEMLQLLAVAYNSSTWHGYNKIPETKLACVIQNLLRVTNIYKSAMTKAIEKFYNCQFETIRHKYRGKTGSKLHNLYVHLELTSHKIQMAYSHLASVLQKLDGHLDSETDDAEFNEILQRHVEDAYKQIDNARDFAESSRLLMSKMQNSANSDKQHFQENSLLVPILKPNVPLVRDMEPHIVDEVFEEFIKEEYLKPLYDDGDDVMQKSFKLEKLLTKNFMSELKEALVDKHKAMSERECRALKRMQRNFVESNSPEVEQNLSDASAESDVNGIPRSNGFPNSPSLPSLFDSTSEDSKGDLSYIRSYKDDDENKVKIGYGYINGSKLHDVFIPPPPPPHEWNVSVPNSYYDDSRNFEVHSKQVSIPTSLPRQIAPCVPKVTIKPSTIENYQNTVPVPPPRKLDVPNIHQDKMETSGRRDSCSPLMPPPLSFNSRAASIDGGEYQKKEETSLTCLEVHLRPFLGAAEETFFGSGENSEDELIDSEPEEDGML